MKRLLYLATLLMAASLIFAPAALAQDVDCPQLTFEEAQAILAADPSDPNRLDADNDGIACDRSNTLPSQPAETQQTVVTEQTVITEEQPQMMEQTQMEQPKMMEQTQPKMMPKTGGVEVGSLLLPASALLVGTGILGFAIARRR